MAVAGGAHGYVRIAGALIEATFGGASDPPHPPMPQDATLTPFPWAQAIGFGLGVLRLSPEHFWRMTPRELALAIEAVCGRAAEPLARATFDRTDDEVSRWTMTNSKWAAAASFRRSWAGWSNAPTASPPAPMALRAR